VCAEKDKRIEDMREQITYLRNLLNPPAKPVSYEEPQNFQADVILNGGGGEESSLPQDQNLETPEVLAERAAMLSGTY
jgi:hypothetical protein